MKKKVAIVAITKGGTILAHSLHRALPGSDLWVSPKFLDLAGEGGIPLRDSLRRTVGDFFRLYKKIVFFVSLGAVVRLIAPHLRDKKEDPAVLVVDDRGTFVISLLSGHVGGANAFTEEVARLLGAAPVITTASDVGQTIPVDILGRELGWTLEGEENVTRVSAAVVNEEPIAFVQECGERTWWTRKTPLPSNIRLLRSVDDLGSETYEGCLLVTDRILDLPPALRERCVIYRPRSLVLGMGCDRGTPIDELESLIRETLKTDGLSMASVRSLASIDLKREEPAFRELRERYGWELVFFNREELDRAPGVERPSEIVRKWTGTGSVSEAAALLAGGAERLLIPKVKSTKATLAVARWARFPDGE